MAINIFVDIDYADPVDGQLRTYHLSNVAVTRDQVYYPYLTAVPSFSIGGDGYAVVKTGQLSMIRSEDTTHPFSGERYYKLISKAQEIPFRIYIEDEEAPIFVGNIALSEVTEDEFRFLIIEDDFEKNLVYPVLQKGTSLRCSRFYLYRPNGSTELRIMIANGRVDLNAQDEVIFERYPVHSQQRNEVDTFIKLVYVDNDDNRYIVSDRNNFRFLLTNKDDNSQYITVSDLLNYYSTSLATNYYPDESSILTAMNIDLNSPLDHTMTAQDFDADGNPTDVLFLTGQQLYEQLMYFDDQENATGPKGELFEARLPDIEYRVGTLNSNPFSFGRIKMRDPVVVFGDMYIKKQFLNFQAGTIDTTPDSANALITTRPDIKLIDHYAGVIGRPSQLTVVNSGNTADFTTSYSPTGHYEHGHYQWSGGGYTLWSGASGATSASNAQPLKTRSNSPIQTGDTSGGQVAVTTSNYHKFSPSKSSNRAYVAPGANWPTDPLHLSATNYMTFQIAGDLYVANSSGSTNTGSVTAGNYYSASGGTVVPGQLTRDPSTFYYNTSRFYTKFTMATETGDVIENKHMNTTGSPTFWDQNYSGLTDTSFVAVYWDGTLLYNSFPTNGTSGQSPLSWGVSSWKTFSGHPNSYKKYGSVVYQSAWWSSLPFSGGKNYWKKTHRSDGSFMSETVVLGWNNLNNWTTIWTSNYLGEAPSTIPQSSFWQNKSPVTNGQRILGVKRGGEIVSLRQTDSNGNVSRYYSFSVQLENSNVRHGVSQKSQGQVYSSTKATRIDWYWDYQLKTSYSGNITINTSNGAAITNNPVTEGGISYSYSSYFHTNYNSTSSDGQYRYFGIYRTYTSADTISDYTFTPVTDSWYVAVVYGYSDHRDWTTAIQGVPSVPQYDYEDARERIYSRSNATSLDAAYGVGWSNNRNFNVSGSGYYLTQITIEFGTIYESALESKIQIITDAGYSPINGSTSNIPQHIKFSQITNGLDASTTADPNDRIQSNIYQVYRNDNIASDQLVGMVVYDGTRPSITLHSSGATSLVYKITGLGLSYDSRADSACISFRGFAGTVVQNLNFEDAAGNDLGNYNPSGSPANNKKEESFYELPIGTQAITLSIGHDPQEVFDSYSDGIYGIDLKFHQRVLPEMNQTLGAKVTYATKSAAEIFYSDTVKFAEFSDLIDETAASFYGDDYDESSEDRGVYVLHNPSLSISAYKDEDKIKVFDNGRPMGDEGVYLDYSNEDLIYMPFVPFGQIAISGLSIHGETVHDFYKFAAKMLKEEDSSIDLDIDVSRAPLEKTANISLPIYQDSEITVIEMAQQVAKNTNHIFFFRYEYNTITEEMTRKLVLVDLNHVLSEDVQYDKIIQENQISNIDTDYPYPVKAFESTLEKNVAYSADEDADNAASMKRQNFKYRVTGSGVGKIENVDVFAQEFAEGKKWMNRLSETKQLPNTIITYEGIDRDISLGYKIRFTDFMRKLIIEVIAEEISYDFTLEMTTVQGVSKFEEIVYRS